METDDIYIDDETGADEIDGMELTSKQLFDQFDAGSLSHLSQDDVKALLEKAAARATAGFHSTTVR
jgi:hypothetical protein